MGLPDLLANGGNILLLAGIGLGAGVMSGFAGVGGSFIVTPALIVIGFPANFAVGTSLAWVMGNSIVGVMRHAKLGNVDWSLGLVTLIASSMGLEGGVRLLNLARNAGLADEVVLSMSVVMLAIVGGYTLYESHHRKKHLDNIRKGGATPQTESTAIPSILPRFQMPPVLHFKRSGVTISLWILLGVSLFVGVLAGVMGVGGGFVMVPALVYLVGVPSFIAVGTGLFQIVFTSAYGTIRHTLSGNVFIFAAFIMIITSGIGVQFGALVTRYVRGLSVRYVLGVAIILGAVGAVFKLIGIVYTTNTKLFEGVSIVVTLGSLLVSVLMVVALYITALKHRRGMPVPGWMESFITDEHAEKK